MNRRAPSLAARKQAIHYAAKAIALIKAEALPLSMLDVRMVRLMLETMPGSDSERRHALGGLARFLAWCRRQGLIELNPCDDLDRGERPSPASRDHVPTLATLRAVWAAVADEPQRDLLRFLLLTPLRLSEAAALDWSEVDLGQGRIRIGAARMKARETHELPLSEAALAILEARPGARTGLIFPSGEGKPFDAWSRLMARIRKRIGEGGAEKARRFSPHDVRRSFVSHLAERGFDVDLIDQCLAHKRQGVLAVYQRSSRMAERQRALDAWADLVTGETEGTSNVVAFRAAR